MAYCVQCGTAVGGSDKFCAGCRAPQAATAGPASGKAQQDVFKGLSDRNAALLCYIPWVGWIAAIVVLASDRFRRTSRLRFHAFQGLYIFAAWLMVEWVILPVSRIVYDHSATRLLELGIVALWVFMLVKVSQGEDYHLPVIGEMAERSASEQQP